MLCNALIQPHFDYACTAWYPNLTKKQKRRYKKEVMQNKCIGLCLRLNKMQHMSLADFRLINLLPTKEIVHQCIYARTFTFKFVDKKCPFYLNKIFEFTPQSLRQKQKTLSCIGPCLWNNLPETIKKKTKNLNSFKHNVQNLYLNQ